MKWLEIALMELGDKVAEKPGLAHHERILEYHRATSLKASDDETAWCSSFVAWAMEQAGVPSTRSAAARSWLRWGELLEEPRLGCVVVLSRGTKSWQGHVGLYAGSRGPWVYVLGGNQGNAVSVARYPRERVLGYRWPSEKRFDA